MDPLVNYLVVPGADWNVRDKRKGYVSFGSAVAEPYEALAGPVG